MSSKDKNLKIQKLEEYEQRPITLSEVEIEERRNDLMNFRGSSIIAGYNPSEEDDKLMELFITGRVSEEEMLEYTLLKD